MTTVTTTLLLIAVIAEKLNRFSFQSLVIPLSNLNRRSLVSATMFLSKGAKRISQFFSKKDAIDCVEELSEYNNVNGSTIHPLKGEKIFYMIRHGTTEANEWLERNPWGRENFQEIGLWDTQLSNKGRMHATNVHRILRQRDRKIINFDEVEVVITSPLTRTIQTAKHLFYHEEDLLPNHIPRIAHPLLAERLYLASDMGRMKHELLVEFPEWDFSHLPHDKEWWYTPNSTEEYREWRPKGKYLTHGEPTEAFRQRMVQLREFLLARPERCLVVVCHWGVLHALTGREFENCEIQRISVNEILPYPLIA